MDRTYWTYVFASFQGRINRQPFWIGCGILAAVELASQWLALRIQGEQLSTVLDLAFTYPEFALAVKRAHDRDLSPWLVALFFAVNVALDLFTLLNGAIDIDSPINELITLPFALLAGVLLLDLGFRRACI